MMDDTTLKENSKIYLFGIALFSYLALVSIVYTLRIIFEDLLIINEISFKRSFWIYNSISLALFIVGIILSLKILKNLKPVHYFRILIIFIIILILSQIIQFLVTFYGYDFILENYSIEFDKYYNSESDKAIYGTYYAIFEYLRYLSLGLIVFINIKKSKINSIS